MPGLARLVPELREQIFYRHWFFDHWTARLELGLAGIVVARLSRNPAWLLSTIPYVDAVRREAVAYPRSSGSRVENVGRAVVHALGHPAVDAATVAGLITGSVAWSCVVL
jgi:hypothetical protein